MLEKYIYKNNQKMRLGYTTGSCAAGAAKAAVQMLLYVPALLAVYRRLKASASKQDA